VTLLVAPGAVALPGRRIAVVAGNDVGAPGEVELRYARTDAQRVAQVLRELGGVAPADLYLLLDGDAGSMREALAAAAERSREGPEPATLLFFYSGHADAQAMHLGSSRFTWDELRAALETGPAQLRVAFVDACQAGALTLPKGFVVGPPAAQGARGFAVLASADLAEQAQEMGSLGGSIFTHYLVSGMRGAADTDGDGRVTLAELHSHTARNTARATAAWTGSLQHPAFHFDISGQGDIVVSELRQALATLEIGNELAGHLVVSERGTRLIVAEAEKAAGRPLRLAVPSGRYVVYLRAPSEVGAAEVDIPWGGSATLGAEQFTSHSYQSVAQKGTLIEVRRQRLVLEGGVQSPAVSGMGATPLGRLEYSFRFAPVELGLRLQYLHSRFDTVDTRAATTVVGLGALLAHEAVLRQVDVRLWVFFEEGWWRQAVDKEGVRTAMTPTFGAGAGVRVPVLNPLFASLGIEGLLHVPQVQDRGAVVRGGVRATLGVGIAF